MAQVNDNAGKEAGFGQAQEKTRGVELPGRPDQPDEDRADSPGYENTRDPAPRAPAFDDQRARDLQQHVPGKEDTRAEPEDRLAEPELGAHGRAHERNVCAIEISDDVQNEYERKDAARDFAPRPKRDVTAGCRPHRCPPPRCPEPLGTPLQARPP